MRWAGQKVDMMPGYGESRDTQVDISRIQVNADIGATLHELADLVAAWQGPISVQQLLRLREAADALLRVAQEIDEENWSRFGQT